MSKCILSKGHDWDGDTCLACGRTRYDDYRDRIEALKADNQRLLDELKSLKADADSLKAFCRSEIRKISVGSTGG